MTRVDILAQSTGVPSPDSIEIADKADKSDATALKDSLVKDPSMGNLLVGKLATIALPANPAGELQLFFDSKAMADLWIAVKYRRI